MIVLRAVVLCFISTIWFSAFSQTKTSNNKNSGVTLFTINKKPVTAEEFIYLYEKNHQSPDDFTTEKIDEYFNLYVNFKLKVEEARRRGLDTTAAFIREYNQYKDELRKPYLPGNGLTDSLAKLTYDRLKQEVKASHILVSVKPDATPEDTLKAYKRIVELRNRVVGGEDFGKLAFEFSEDPSAKSNRGDLGYFTAMQMVYPFENAAYTTSTGSVSKPVRTRFGYHILFVSDKRPAKGEVEVSHIMIRTGGENDNSVAKNTIFNVYDQLQAGVKWDDLCKQFSEDLSTKESGGKLRPFGSGMMSNVPEFERVAFELEKPGQISDPFETQYGWHIVKLERKIPLASYEELAASLKNKVSRDERAQISKQALQQKLRRDLAFEEVSAVKSKVFSLADSSLQQGKWKPVLDSKTMGSTLFKLQTRTFSVKDFYSYVLKNQRTNSQEPVRYLEQLYNAFVEESILSVQETAIMQKTPEYKYLLNEYYEGILLFEIMEKEVWNKASEDSLGQYRFYESNMKEYSAGDRVKATFYSAADSSLLEDLKVLVVQGDQKKIQEYANKNKIKTETGYFKKGDKSILSRIPWEKGVFKVESNGMYYLAWIKDVLAEGRMSFEEARPTLISDYQNYLENNWVAQLKKKYPVKVSKKGKEYILSQLQKK